MIRRIFTLTYLKNFVQLGRYTAKYHKCREMMTKLIQEKKLPKVHLPDLPREQPVKAYGNIKFVDYLTLDDLASQLTPLNLNQPKTMEQIDQGYGFILYRISHAKFSQLKVQSKCWKFIMLIIPQINII